MELAGKHILVVEDEAILALSIEDILAQHGCVVVGPALTIAQAEKLISATRVDAAVLDINVNDEQSFPVARALRSRAVPFCFATGYGASGVPEEFAGIPVLTKPYGEAALAQVLRNLVA